MMQPDETGISDPGPPSPAWASEIPAELLSTQRILTNYAKINNIKFTVGGQPVLAEQVFQPECLMPIISLEANRIWHMLGQSCVTGSKDPDQMGDLGAIYERDENGYGYFGCISHPPAIADDVTSTMRLLTFLYATRRVLALKENHTIDLLPYIKAWDTINWDLADQTREMPEIPLPEEFDLEFQMSEFSEDKPVAEDVENEISARTPSAN